MQFTVCVCVCICLFVCLYSYGFLRQDIRSRPTTLPGPLKWSGITSCAPPPGKFAYAISEQVPYCHHPVSELLPITCSYWSMYSRISSDGRDRKTPCDSIDLAWPWSIVYRSRTACWKVMWTYDTFLHWRIIQISWIRTCIIWGRELEILQHQEG